MKAIVQNDYGGVHALRFKDVDKPVIGEDEVLVRVRASSVNAGDLFTVKGTPYVIRFENGFPKPKDTMLGWDVAGIIEEIGEKVEGYSVGDEVYGSTEYAFAEYVKMTPNEFARKPSNISFEEAAAIPTAGITALQQLRDNGKLKEGQKVLITGASGGVGSFAVQIAKVFGAEVTGVCSTEKVEMVQSIGADHVIDYKKDDFTKSSQRFDLILDNAGKWRISDMLRVLTPGGVIVPNSGHGGMGYLIRAFARSMMSNKVVGMTIADLNTKDFQYLNELVESRKLSPVVDKVYPFEEIIEAIAYFESGQAKGKVVIVF